jgi:hypothetical protein
MTIREDIDTEALRHMLEELRLQHLDLDAAIAALEKTGIHNGLQIQRMKKRKLLIRDQISHIENRLLPNIIA